VQQNGRYCTKNPGSTFSWKDMQDSTLCIQTADTLHHDTFATQSGSTALPKMLRERRRTIGQLRLSNNHALMETAAGLLNWSLVWQTSLGVLLPMYIGICNECDRVLQLGTCRDLAPRSIWTVGIKCGTPRIGKQSLALEPSFLSPESRRRQGKVAGHTSMLAITSNSVPRAFYQYRRQ